MRRTARSLIVGLLLLPLPGLAEHADRDAPMYLSADRVDIDDASHVSTFVGKVRMTQGTLIIMGDRVVITETADGEKHGTVTGAPGFFRQKREGLEEWVEGYGDRIEYDTRNEFLELFGHARMKRDQDEVEGEHITYNSRSEVFHVDSHDKADDGPRRGRVHAVIQPKKREDANKPATTDQPAGVQP